MRKPRTSPAPKSRKAAENGAAAPAPATKRRKAAVNGTATAAVGTSKLPEELPKGSTKATTRGKRVKAPSAEKPHQEPEYLAEKRNLEDLWQCAFPIGTEWDNMDKLREINWSFTNLENAFDEDGELYGKKVYMFGSTEPQLLVVNGEQKVILIPVVVVICQGGGQCVLGFSALLNPIYHLPGKSVDSSRLGCCADGEW